MQPTSPVQPTQMAQPVGTIQPLQTRPAVQFVESSHSVSATYRASQLVYLVLGIVEALIAIRVVLKLFAANADSGFASLMYAVSAPLVVPFQGIFPTPATHNNVLELSSIVGMVVYALVGWAIVRAVTVLARRQPAISAH
jgi:hypothetical protein